MSIWEWEGGIPASRAETGCRGLTKCTQRTLDFARFPDLFDLKNYNQIFPIMY